MSGTKAGGAKMKQTILKRYGLTEDGQSKFHKEIGAIGGKVGTTGGFAHWKAIGREDLIVQAGAKGGTISRKNRKWWQDKHAQS